MQELIDRQALIADYRICGGCSNFENCKGYVTMCDSARIRQAINEAPTIEPEERHGLWIKLPPALNPSERPHKCSECGHVLSFYGAYPKACYCPNCGAKMDGGTENV